jgi:hypothetical protein
MHIGWRIGAMLGGHMKPCLPRSASFCLYATFLAAIVVRVISPNTAAAQFHSLLPTGKPYLRVQITLENAIEVEVEGDLSVSHDGEYIIAMVMMPTMRYS